MHEAHNLIDGAWTGAGDDGLLEDRNPSDTEDLVAQIPSLGQAQVHEAVQAAAKAFDQWRSVSPVTRGEILQRAGGLLRDRVDSVADLLRREAGKPLKDARGEVLKSADFLEYYGALGRAGIGELLPDARPGVFSYSMSEPLGVVVAITPWNDPLLTPARKLGPALVAGNTVVIKPATDTPIVTQQIASVLSDAGLPAGVINTVTGRGSVIGEALTDAPEVAAVTFTGSTVVGKQLWARCAGRGVRVQTEMGGKNATVVMPDADLDLAGRTLVAAAFGGIGQRCTATSRLLVHRDVRDELTEALMSAMDEIRVGPTSDESFTHGPVVSQAQMTSVLAAIDTARSQGGQVVRGGGRLTETPLDRGWFIDPTVVSVETDTALWTDEVFGPVLAMTTFTSLEEAIDLVNASTYGLSASIFSRDLGTSHRFVAAADTGQVSVNLPTSGWDVQLPFGGFKDSGSLFKEQGTAALGFYTRLKTVAMKTA